MSKRKFSLFVPQRTAGRKAFSLTELLVVISLMTILLMGASYGYTKSRTRARDANRRASVKGYSHSLELYYTVRRTYVVYYKDKNNTCDLASTALNDLNTTAVGSGCVGYKGKGWGAITRKNIIDYSAKSIADALVNEGFLSQVKTDPSISSFDQHNNTLAEYDDFLLTLCQPDGRAATTEKNATDYAIYAKMENPTPQESDYTSRLCGGPNTAYSFPGWPSLP